MLNRLLPLLVVTILGLLSQASGFAAIQYFDDRATFLSGVNVNTNIDFEGIAGSGQKVSFSNPTGLTIAGVNFVGRANLATTNAPPDFVNGFSLFVAANNAAAPQTDYEFNSGASLEWYYGDSFNAHKDTTVTITLPANTKVFGTDLMFRRNWAFKSNGATNPDNIGTKMTVQLSDGTYRTVNMEPSDDNPNGAGIPNRSFFGFVSDTPIAFLTIHAGSLPGINQTNGGYSTFQPHNFFVDGGHPLLDNVVLGTKMAAVPEPTSAVLFGICMAGLGYYSRRRRS